MDQAASRNPDSNELIAIIGEYNLVTDRLKRSHDALRREVCRLRDELHEKNKELQRRERLAALGEMAAGLAHEIRNPLGGIRLYASLMERNLVDRPKSLDLVRKLDVGVRNLDAIVTDILAFAGGAEPALERVTAGEIVAETIANCRPQAEKKRVKLIVDDELLSAELVCDAGQIERAMLNLALNAIEAVEPGGTVRISEVRPAQRSNEIDEFCDIAFEDDGPGIASDLLQKVFHPFFTTKHTGTGLGLAIVHRIAEANGGCIRAANRTEGGAVFTLSLPRAKNVARRSAKDFSHSDFALLAATAE